MPTPTRYMKSKSLDQEAITAAFSCTPRVPSVTRLWELGVAIYVQGEVQDGRGGRALHRLALAPEQNGHLKGKHLVAGGWDDMGRCANPEPALPRLRAILEPLGHLAKRLLLQNKQCKSQTPNARVSREVMQ